MKQKHTTQVKNQPLKISRLPIINSTVAFVLAALLATTIHELSHLTMARILGDKAALFPNFVIDNNAIHNQIIVAATGPLFSLVSGFLLIWLTMKWGKNFWTLLAKWFAFLSAEIGIGYLFIAPFAKAGDTGQVLNYLHASFLVYSLFFVIGVIGVWLVLPKLFERSFSPHATDKRSFFQLGMWPWLIGTGVLFVIYNIVESVIASHHIHNPGVFIIIGVITTGVFTPVADFKPQTASTSPRPLTLTWPTIGLCMTIAVAIFLIAWPVHGYIFG